MLSLRGLHIFPTTKTLGMKITANSQQGLPEKKDVLCNDEMLRL